MPWGRGPIHTRRASQSRNKFDPQNQNLFMHIPMTDMNTPKPANYGWPGHFKSTKGNHRVTVYDPNNVGYTTFDQDIKIRTCASTGQYGAGNACNYRVSSWDQQAGYNGNTKNYRTPQKFTVMLWFKMYGWSNSWNHLMGDVKPGGSTTWFANWVLRLQSSGVIRYYCCDGTPSNSGEVVSNSGEIALNKIYLATMTYDGSSIRGYLNDRLIGVASYSAGIGNVEGSLELACDNQELGNILSVNGTIWDFRMYSAALSGPQVRDVYWNHWRLYAKTAHPALSSHVPSIITADLSQSVTIAQTINFNRALARGLTQSITVSQRINREAIGTVTHSFTTSQTIAGVVGANVYVMVNHDLGVSQIIGSPRFSRVARVTQSLAMSDTTTNNSTFVTHTLTLSQSISFTKAVNARVTQTLGVVDDIFVNSPRLMNVYHNFLAYDSVSARNSVTRISLVHSLSVSQSLTGRNATFRFTVTQSFTTSQTLYRRDAIYRVSVTDTLSVAHRVNTIYRKKLEQDFTVVQAIDKYRLFTRNLVTTVSVSSDFDKTREIIRNLESRVEVSSTFDRSIEVTRNFTEQVGVKSNFTPVLIAAPGQLHLPGIEGGPPEFGAPAGQRLPIEGVETATGNIVKIEVPGSLILLPAPQLANTLEIPQSLIKNRTETGATEAHPVTTGQEGFEYTFFLDRPKAYELRRWVELYHSDRMVITNWRGEKWSGYLITEEIDLTFESVRAGNAAEKVVVPLKFRGVRL